MLSQAGELVADRTVGAVLIDGAALSRNIRRQTRKRAEALSQQGITPTLAVLYVGEAADAESYRKQIATQASRAGVTVRTMGLPAAATMCELDDTLLALNQDRAVHAVLVQTPLSPELRRVVLGRLSSDKDPEGVTPRHVGMLFLGDPEVLPCTPAAILTMIKSWRADLTGTRVVVVNGSSVIGRPLAMLLLEEGATPTICTRHTRDLARETGQAEVLVTAAGVPHLIGPDHVAPGALVIDAAVNRLPDGTLTGDVDTAAVRDRAAAITPVPGGVGPVTTAMLLANVVALADLHRGAAHPYG